MSEASPIHILLVEDDDAYAALIRAELDVAGGLALLRRVSTLTAAITTLEGGTFDVILLDLGLPDSEGLGTVARMHAAAPAMAILVLTATDDDALALAAVQAGAEDYLLKGATDTTTLRRALRHARERAVLRRALLEREARFRALVEHSYDAITLVDERFVMSYDSRAVEKMTGYAPAERIGRRLDEFAHPEDLPEIERQFALCVADPDYVPSIEFRYGHKDGSWRWGEAVFTNRLADPAVQAVVINHRDVSDRKMAEQALKVSEAQLRQAHKMEAVGRLAGGVAHDFNNVLTAIFGYVDLLADQFGEDDPRRPDLDEIRRSAERAASLTRQLLAFSRKQVMQPRLLNLNDVITGLQKLLARLVSEDISVILELSDDLWKVRADPGQIEQVLMNLTANARDAMPEGGRLVFATGHVTVATLDTVNRPGLKLGDYVTMTITDSGTGMPLSVQKHIFEPFFTTKEQGKGTGLGLATVYGIVKQTGGGVYVESGEGQGTRFVIYLPRVP